MKLVCRQHGAAGNTKSVVLIAVGLGGARIQQVPTWSAAGTYSLPPDLAPKTPFYRTSSANLNP